MDFTWNSLDAGSDDEDAGEGDPSKWRFGSRDGLIFLIDCSKDMFHEDDDQVPFELCIKCAKSVIQSKIISNNKDLLGVVFYGTKKENVSNFKNIFILQDLDQPSAERVLQLENFLEKDDFDDFSTKFGHSDSYSIGDALWTCQNMFSNCSQKLGFKRIMLFTNNDSPHDGQLKKQAATKMEDLHSNHIEVELMHLNKPGCHFNYEAFYKDVLIIDDDENMVIPDPAEKFEELLSRVRMKEYKKRTLSRIPFSFGNGLDMAVGVYTLVRSCTKPSSIKLYSKTNEEVRSVTKTFLSATGEILMPQDMKKMQTYGGKNICFEKEEITQIQTFDPAGAKLMGFKPRECLKKYPHIRPAQFIYPEDTQIQGSTTLFTALLKKCLEKQVVAICRFTPRRNRPPRFVALVPQEEELDEHNFQVAPPGFHVIYLPFADDFRNIKFNDMPKANEDQIDKAKEIVKKLRFRYSSEAFENPVLQKHYANVEAMALDRDQPEDIDDKSLPDDEMITKRAGRLIKEFSEMVFPEGYVPGAKRRAPGGSSGAGAKRIKTEVDVDIEAEAKAGRLNTVEKKLTVNILKEFIKSKRIRCTGTRKADLISAIEDHYSR